MGGWWGEFSSGVFEEGGHCVVSCSYCRLEVFVWVVLCVWWRELEWMMIVEDCGGRWYRR